MGKMVGGGQASGKLSLLYPSHLHIIIMCRVSQESNITSLRIHAAMERNNFRISHPQH